MKITNAIVAAISVGYLSIGASAQCPADLITDGIVDGIDLAAILGAWGTSGGIHGGDIDFDGIVSGSDLAFVLSGWGPCPPAADCSQANWLPGADLHGCDFSGMQMGELNLSGANLRGANFTNTTLSGDLSNANLFSANFTGAYVGANMLGADLTNAKLNDAVLSCNCAGATFRSADLTNVTANGNFQSANLTGANLSGASFTGSSWCGLMNLEGTNLSGANLTGARLELVSLFNANVSNVNLTNVYFDGVQTELVLGLPAVFGEYRMLGNSLLGPGVFLKSKVIEDLDLTNINLSRACFMSCRIRRVNLTNAKLVGTRFNGPMSMVGCYAIYNTGSDLYDVNLTGADLTGAWQFWLYSAGIIGTPAALPAGWRLIGGAIFAHEATVGPADCSGLDLSGVDFHDMGFDGTNFSGANLAGANFSGAGWWVPRTILANFTGANLTNADFSGSMVGRYSYGACILTNANLANTNFANCAMGPIWSGGVLGTPINLPLSHRLVSGYLLGPQAILRYANLSGLDLSGVNLANAALSFANLRDTNLAGANLREVYDWYAADCSNANLTNADLSAGWNLQYANFTNAIWNNTVCPIGGAPQDCSCQAYPNGGCP